MMNVVTSTNIAYSSVRLDKGVKGPKHTVNWGEGHFLNELILSEERVVLCIEAVFHSFQNRRYQKHAVVA